VFHSSGRTLARHATARRHCLQRTELAARLQAVLGEREAATQEGTRLREAAANPADVYAQCFKRLLRSMDQWTKPGRGGYLRFIGGFV
jgi:hypothetical protein